VPVYAGASISSKQASRDGHVRGISSHGSRYSSPALSIPPKMTSRLVAEGIISDYDAVPFRSMSREGGPSSRGGAGSVRDESVDDIIAAFPAGSRPLTGGGPFSRGSSRWV
jgi:hypothetical protein